MSLDVACPVFKVGRGYCQQRCCACWRTSDNFEPGQHPEQRLEHRTRTSCVLDYAGQLQPIVLAYTHQAEITHQVPAVTDTGHRLSLSRYGQCCCHTRFTRSG